MTPVSYKHRDCGRVTSVDSPLREYQLANPYCLCMGMTVCAACGGPVPLSDVKFKKHKETVAAFRRRMRGRRLWVWLVYPACAMAGYFILGDLLIQFGNKNVGEAFDRVFGAFLGFCFGFIAAPIVYHVSNFGSPVNDLTDRRATKSNDTLQD